jgi:aspartate kinase
MKVAKFGGTSLATADSIRRVLGIVTSDPERRLVVVSAPGKRNDNDTKVTDLLIALARTRIGGESGEPELAQVVDRYRELAQALGVGDEVVAEIEADLRKRMAADTFYEAAFTDVLKAAGEDNCAKLVARFLCAQGINASYVDPRAAGMLLSDEPGNAQVLPEAYDKLSRLREREGTLIFPGFFGYARSGNVVTFPRGGSDITGAILAAAVEAEVYENWTDVDSVFAASPKVVSNPKPVAEITYREMRELAYAGFSVLHGEALMPCYRAGVPVCIKNTNNPAAPGTRIVSERQPAPGGVVGIAAAPGFCTLYVSKYLMNREVGFGRRLLQILEDERISYEHTPSGIDSISVIMRKQAFTPESEARVLEQVRVQCEVDEVAVERGLALVMVVGEGMRHTVGLAARACGALAKAGVNIEMINQGSSEVSMMFGVVEAECDAAVRALYGEFFEAR